MAFQLQMNGQVYQGEDERKVEAEIQKLFDDFVDQVEAKVGKKILVSASFNSTRGSMNAGARPMAPGTTP